MNEAVVETSLNIQLEELLPTALGDFGLEYKHFMSLTPKEWVYICDGKRQKEERRLNNTKCLIAWQTAYLMNATGNFKEPVTVEKLLGIEVPNNAKKYQEPMDFAEISKAVAK